MTLFKGNGSKENIPSINSSGNALFVYFTSNGSVSESGFSATYYTNRVGKKKFLLITCRHTINLFIFAITTYRLIWTWMMFFFSFNHCITCPSLHYSIWLYFWQHFQTFWTHDLFWCLFMKRRHNYRWLNIMRNENIHENTNANYVGFFWTVWPFTLWTFLIYFRLYLQSSKRFSVSNLI